MPLDPNDSILKSLIAKPEQLGSSEAPSFLNLLASVGRSASSNPYSSLGRTLDGAGAFPTTGLSQSFLEALTVKPKVFVSYHHGGDRWHYDEFKRVFADSYEVCDDNSVAREIDSDVSEYVIRAIRENYLTGTSCTIVLCGAFTRWRKFVDWEIKATLDKQHGLIGVNLPTNPRDSMGRVHVPDRLNDNIDSGFACWIEWNELVSGGPDKLRTTLSLARLSPASGIQNSRELRKRNG